MVAQTPFAAGLGGQEGRDWGVNLPLPKKISKIKKKGLEFPCMACPDLGSSVRSQVQVRHALEHAIVETRYSVAQTGHPPASASLGLRSQICTPHPALHCPQTCCSVLQFVFLARDVSILLPGAQVPLDHKSP